MNTSLNSSHKQRIKKKNRSKKNATKESVTLTPQCANEIARMHIMIQQRHAKAEQSCRLGEQPSSRCSSIDAEDIFSLSKWSQKYPDDAPLETRRKSGEPVRRRRFSVSRSSHVKEPASLLSTDKDAPKDAPVIERKGWFQRRCSEGESGNESEEAIIYALQDCEDNDNINLLSNQSLSDDPYDAKASRQRRRGSLYELFDGLRASADVRRLSIASMTTITTSNRTFPGSETVITDNEGFSLSSANDKEIVVVE